MTRRTWLAGTRRRPVTGSDVPQHIDGTLGEAPAPLVAAAGDRFEILRLFAYELAEHGVVRGLIGPREVPRIWDRHIANSGAIAPLLASGSSLIDVGSGAGLPGVVVAILRPDVSVTLVEPMERRVAWLIEVVERIGLTNTTVLRGRADEFDGAIDADVVTARAVAKLSTLAGWCLPLVRSGGELLALKGRTADEELAASAKSIRKAGGVNGRVEEIRFATDLESTHVVRIRKR